MRPAETTDIWADADPSPVDAMAGVSLITARNEKEEALALAIALREAVEIPGKIAALVTPDRTLAKQVAVELQRWSIRIDDSAGQALEGTAAGVFVRLFAEAAFDGDVIALLALAKHPLARFGMSRPHCRRAAKVLEIAILRGPGSVGAVGSLAERVMNVRLRTEMKADGFTPRARRRLRRQDWALAEALAGEMDAAIGPVHALTPQRSVSVAEATDALAGGLQLATAETGGTVELWEGRAGAALSELVSGLISGGRGAIPPSEYSAFISAAMAGVTVTPESDVDPRIHIWGTLEARLQYVDLMVLGGLDEGVWPGQTRSDAWLSRRMRESIGLPPPEQRVGQAARDFAEAMAAETVIVSRAERRGGAPTVPSRWLARLAALLGSDRIDEMTARGERFLEIARDLDAVPPEQVRPAPRPQPTPRLDARPRELSVTSIETLIRDPYSVYARRVLQLEPLEPIGQRADARLRGSLIHEVFADFTRGAAEYHEGRAKDRFLSLWRHHFEAIEAYPEVHAVWTLRAEPIADWFVAWEAARADDVAARRAEIAGDHVFETASGGFRLTGRADRIDLLHDGRISIFDYKTGALATPKQVLLFQPQLALEGAMARAGGFGSAFAGRQIAELAWIGLGRIGKDDPLRSAVEDDTNPDALTAEALTRLRDLIAAYDDPTKGYVSQARPMFERRFPGDYDHLARVAEWRLAAGAPG